MKLNQIQEQGAPNIVLLYSGAQGFPKYYKTKLWQKYFLKCAMSTDLMPDLDAFY